MMMMMMMRITTTTTTATTVIIIIIIADPAKQRNGKGRAAFLQPTNIWSTYGISFHSKIKLCKSNLRSVLSHGADMARDKDPPSRKRRPSTAASEQSSGSAGQTPSATPTCGREHTSFLQNVKPGKENADAGRDIRLAIPQLPELPDEPRHGTTELER